MEYWGHLGNRGKINSAKDTAEMAIAALSGKEAWSSIQEINIRRQISIDTTLQKIEIGLASIFGLLFILAIKLIV